MTEDLKAAVERLRDAGKNPRRVDVDAADICLVLDALRKAQAVVIAKEVESAIRGEAGRELQAKVREQGVEIERLKKRTSNLLACKNCEERAEKAEAELAAERERAEKFRRALIRYAEGFGGVECALEALCPVAQPETKPRCKCPPYEDCECGPEKPFVEISREDLIAVQHASCGNPRCPVCGCKGFEPCLEGDEGDDPAHNFTCALLCIHCGLPREKHPAAPKPTPSNDPPCACRGDGHKPDCAFWISLGSEQPDLPLGHRYVRSMGPAAHHTPCQICGRPESAHRRK